MEKKFNLEITHKHFDLNKGLRDKSRVLYEGRIEQVVKFLIQGKHELQQDFNRRKKRIFYNNILRPIISARAGLLTRSKVSVTVPKKLESYLSDLDGQKNSVNPWLKDVIMDADIEGICWVMVTLPSMENYVDDEGNPLIRTLKDQIDAGIRPYLKKIPANSVIRWKINENDNKLDWLVTKFEVTEKDEIGYEPISSTRWVVWKRDTIEVYKRDNKVGFILIQEKDNVFGEVNFVPFYGIKDKYPFVGLPFAYAVLDHLTNILNIESEKMDGLGLITVPKLLVMAQEKPDRITQNSDAFFLPITRDGVRPEAKYLEPSGNGVKLAREEITQLVKYIEQNTSFQSKKDTAQVESADTIRESGTVRKADLGSAAINHEGSLIDVFRLMMIAEAPNEKVDEKSISVRIPQDFDASKLDPAIMKEYREIRENGDISQETYWKILFMGERLPEDFAAKDEQNKLLDEKDQQEVTLDMSGV